METRKRALATVRAPKDQGKILLGDDLDSVISPAAIKYLWNELEVLKYPEYSKKVGLWIDRLQSHRMKELKEIKDEVFLGIPNIFPLRSIIYSHIVRGSKSNPESDGKLNWNLYSHKARKSFKQVAGKVDDRVIDCIRCELLDESNTFSQLGIAISELDPDEVFNICFEFHKQVKISSQYVPGSAQMSALFVYYLGFNVKQSVLLMVHLYQLIEPYISVLDKINIGLRKQVLLCAIAIAKDDPELAETLNANNFDVSDLMDVAWMWMFPMFTYHFHVDFIFRAIDLLLILGEGSFSAILYGIMRAFRDTIFNEDYRYVDLKEKRKSRKSKMGSNSIPFISSNSSDSPNNIQKSQQLTKSPHVHSRIFTVVSNLPSKIVEDKLEKVFFYAASLFKKSESFLLHDWSSIARAPGVIKFPLDDWIPHLQIIKRKASSDSETKYESILGDESEIHPIERHLRDTLSPVSNEEPDIENNFEDPLYSIEEFKSSFKSNPIELWNEIQALISSNRRLKIMTESKDDEDFDVNKTR